jgi:multidrug resistance efflux pump
MQPRRGSRRPKPRSARPRRTTRKAGDDVARYKLLVAKDEISQQQYDTAVSTADAAKATVDARTAAVAEAEQNIKVAQSAVEQAHTQNPSGGCVHSGRHDRAAAGRR